MCHFHVTIARSCGHPVDDKAEECPEATRRGVACDRDNAKHRQLCHFTNNTREGKCRLCNGEALEAAEKERREKAREAAEAAEAAERRAKRAAQEQQRARALRESRRMAEEREEADLQQALRESAAEAERVRQEKEKAQLEKQYEEQLRKDSAPQGKGKGKDYRDHKIEHSLDDGNLSTNHKTTKSPSTSASSTWSMPIEAQLWKDQPQHVRGFSGNYIPPSPSPSRTSHTSTSNLAPPGSSRANTRDPPLPKRPVPIATVVSSNNSYAPRVPSAVPPPAPKPKATFLTSITPMPVDVPPLPVSSVPAAPIMPIGGIPSPPPIPTRGIPARQTTSPPSSPALPRDLNAEIQARATALRPLASTSPEPSPTTPLSLDAALKAQISGAPSPKPVPSNSQRSARSQASPVLPLNLNSQLQAQIAGGRSLKPTSPHTASVPANDPQAKTRGKMEARNNESALNTKTGRVDAGAWSLPASAPINELPPQPYAKMSRKDSLNAETEKANIRPIRRPAPAPAPAPVPMSELDAKLARRKAALDAAEAEREDADTERSY